MIYITYRESKFSTDQLLIKNVWQIKYDNVEEKYIDFMLQKAKEINIIVNNNWLNIMDWENNNNHLSIEVYRNKVKQWRKIERQWNIDKFISEKLKGVKENYKEVVRF
jgi:hypothetical protein